MEKVTAIRLLEPSAIDTAVIQEIKRTHGEKRCRSIIDGVVFEITDLLCRIERAVAENQPDGLPDLVERLTELSADVGLICMADVAVDMAECLHVGDRVALTAVAYRLVRLGEDGLFSLIEFTDRSIV